MIYFMTAREIGRVKIGHAKCPEQRLKTLQCGSPAKLIIEATMDGGQPLEAELHNVFHRSRRHGEWFEITPEIDMAIHFLNSGDAIPDDAEAYLAPFILEHFRASRAKVPA